VVTAKASAISGCSTSAKALKEGGSKRPQQFLASGGDGDSDNNAN